MFKTLLVPLVVCLTTLSAESQGKSSAVVTSSDANGLTLRLTTPQPKLVPDDEGFTAVEVEGFATRERSNGAPDVPRKTVLVAIPPESTPRLAVRVLGSPVKLNDVRPRPVGKFVAEPSSADALELADPALSEEQRVRILRRSVATQRTADAEIYGKRDHYPERVAWLGEIGVLRDQRYVELHLAPVRYDGRTGGLEWTPGLEVTVHFDGASGPTTAPEAAPAFETVYRDSFVNYDQGRQFRLGAVSPIAGEEPPAEAAGASSPLFKIRVSQTGITRLDWALLQPTGLLDHALNTWKLTNRGVPVPLHIVDDGDGFLENGEWVQFYGQRLDDDPKTVLNTAQADPIFEYRDFTDVNVYVLAVTAAQPAMPVRDATPTGTPTPPAHFQDTARQEVDDAWRPLGGADPWYWAPTICANTPTGCANNRTTSVPLPGLFSGTEPVQVRVNLRGLSPYTVAADLAIDPDHLTRVTLKNATNQTLAIDDESFDGRTVFQHDFPWNGSGGSLSSPANVQLSVLQVASAPECNFLPCPNDVILDYVEIDYRRSFIASGDRLTFEWPDANAEFVVSGLQDPAPVIYEITLGPGEQVVQPVRLTGGVVTGSGSFSVRFRIDNDPDSDTPRRFVVFGSGGAILVAPIDLEADAISDLRSNANQADLIVIAHSAVLDLANGPCTGATPVGCLSELLAFRATPAGGGLTSKVAVLEDVEDEFNHGLPGPLAIKEFLRWVMSTAPGEGWANRKPAYVLLLGDGSFRYKDGTAQGNFVPTQILFQDILQFGYYASDNLLAAVQGGDSLADLVVGRLPARSTVEANRMLQKALDYEELQPAGAWRNHALFISDRGKTGNNPGEALQFEGLNDASAYRMQQPPYTSLHLRYWSDFYAENPIPASAEPMRQAIKAAINGTDDFDGAALVQFMGHGSFTVWSDDAFFDERLPEPNNDTYDLNNGLRMPWLLAHNCLTGGFHLDAPNTMAENWIKRAGGGAVSTFSPSGLSFNYIGDAVTRVLWDDMFGPRKEREVAVPVLDTLVSLCTQGSIESCQYYVYLGDPALRLAVRSVEPATDVEATAGNAQVLLSWTPSTTPGATYDIYRTTSLAVPIPQYTRVAQGVAGPNHIDSGSSVVNARPYYYYVVAVDEDFESRWSNFNSDCNLNDPELSGPDCVQATPLNPNPPVAPNGLAVTDPGHGNRLRLTWTANPENDIAFYTAHYGTQEDGPYPNTVTFSNTTSGWLTGLTEDVTYYVVLTATNTSEHTSGFSAEVHDFPVLAPGLRPPRIISDLRVRASGANLVVEWGAVTTDVYGKPAQIVSYEVLRGVPPPYANSGLSVIGSCPGPNCPTSTSFTDNGAKTAPGSYFYRVRAVDSQGNRGALGSELPDGTLSLRVNRSTNPANIVVSWSPIVLRVDGGPLDLQHYLLYQSAQPFGPAAIRDGLLSTPTVVIGTSIELPAPAGNRYYSIVAVDIRGNTSPY